MTFGEKLKALRKKKGFSQEKLSQQLNVSRQAVSKWELGETLPDTENVVQLSKLLGVSIDYMLNDEISSENDKPAVRNKFHFTLHFIMGAICSGIGGIGSMILFVLSTMIQVPVTKTRRLPGGSISYYGGGDVLGYNFFEFIQKYRLQALLVILLMLIIVGITIMWYSKTKTRS